MEDQHIVNAGEFKGNSLFAVFDGHGGPKVSHMLKERYEDYLIFNKTEDKQEWLRTSFLEVDQDFKNYDYEGTTANVAYLDHLTE